MEGLPTLVLGIWIKTCLAESPKKAKFLRPEEADWLQDRQSQVDFLERLAYSVAEAFIEP